MARSILSAKTKTTGGKKLNAALRQGKIAQKSGVPGVAVGFYKSAVYQDGTAVTSVAAWNEFGTKKKRGSAQHIPPRPFFRIANSKTVPVVRRYLKARTNPKKLVVTKQMAGQIGNIAKNEIQKSILVLNQPPNAPLTVALKRNTDNPLIDTGHMRQSVTWKVLKN